MFRKYTTTNEATGERISFRAFTKGSAKRKAKRIMRERGWTGFRLRRF